MVTQSSPNLRSTQPNMNKNMQEFFIFGTLKHSQDMIRTVQGHSLLSALDLSLKLCVLGLPVEEPVEPHHVERHGHGGDDSQIDELPHLNSESPLGVLLLKLIAEGD